MAEPLRRFHSRTGLIMYTEYDIRLLMLYYPNGLPTVGLPPNEEED